MLTLKLFRALKNLLLDIFFPKHCVGCSLEGCFLCWNCAEKIEKVKTPTCAECGRINCFGEYCPNCRRRLQTELSGLIVAAQYEAGPTKEMIHHLKYDGFLELVPMLGELMVERLSNRLPEGNIVVVPVPLHSMRQAKRGFNQSELIGRYISEWLNLSFSLALVRSKETEPQVEQTAERRRTNLIGAFEVINQAAIKSKIVLLIDDVATTGSTLNECAKALKAAGAKKVWGAVVSRG